jgi:Ca2+-binding RTX toxin-like protein
MRKILYFVGLVGTLFTLSTGAAFAVYLQCSADTCTGTEGDDEMLGGASSQTFRGLGGVDYIQGSDDDDIVYGNDGGDQLLDYSPSRACGSDQGNDTLYGGKGNDQIQDLRGSDTLYGGPGADSINVVDYDECRFGSTDEAPDMVYGGRGNDSISSNDGQKDTIDCGPGRDQVFIDEGTGIDKVSKNCEKIFPTPNEQQ